ncbi:MAG TPA: DUF2087 domain-containing protein [Clostridiales bacterium]|nr:DUF2087 domain-containing protein [Clostridiales bacterium]HQP69357.1 DUF2087 domain-containing protein [Clostridiales bacterium]
MTENERPVEVSLDRLKDKDGRIIRWPSKKPEKDAVLQYFIGKFEAGKDYTEMEVNTIIKSWHTFSDHTMIRRELVSAKLINRTADGKRYWIEVK